MRHFASVLFVNIIHYSYMGQGACLPAGGTALVQMKQRIVCGRTALDRAEEASRCRIVEMEYNSFSRLNDFGELALRAAQTERLMQINFALQRENVILDQRIKCLHEDVLQYTSGQPLKIVKLISSNRDLQAKLYAHWLEHRQTPHADTESGWAPFQELLGADEMLFVTRRAINDFFERHRLSDSSDRDITAVARD